MFFRLVECSRQYALPSTAFLVGFAAYPTGVEAIGFIIVNEGNLH